ncbi:hypothetical protein VNO77_37665 [Canavalia gladiata]|uniref:Phosphofructokinase domain-containing protein n=1 Tax=Canavalia gladiata TaxID=3824 RepID=A0AAN9K8F8_CANGL
MICSGRDKIETPEQFKQAKEIVQKLDLDGLVVIGGDDSDTNAGLLVEHFMRENMKTRVIGCPKTIDASHITLECALQTHPNITIIREEGAVSRFGYEERCGLPTNFDSTYCYALGFDAATLLQSGKTGLISSVGNLCAPIEEWTVDGTALTSFVDMERRHGEFKPMIKKAMVELEGAPFKKFSSLRDEWALKNFYINPGPIQFIGPGSDAISHTLLLELGAEA